MKVDGSLKSLLQGVSQQPPRDRLPGQCTEQLNMNSDPVAGLTRRAPSDLVANLFSTVNLRGLHEFEVANGQQFLAAFTTEDVVKVYDYNGVPATVTRTGSVDAYIRANGKLRCTAIENNLVITSNGITPAMQTSKKEYANKGTGKKPMGLVQVTGGQYGRDYKIFKDTVLIAHYRPPNGSEAPMVDYTRTAWIASRLFDSMTTTGADSTPDGAGSFLKRTGACLAANGWTVRRYEDVLWIIDERANATEFSLDGTDDAGNTRLKAVTDNVALPADLPRIAPNRYVARVAKELDPEEDMWLEFRAENGSQAVGTGFGEPGYWQETTSPDTDTKINPATMPIILEYKGNNVFELREGRWTDRKVGTDTSNPLPSFIGTPIQDVTTFQSRLVLLTGSYVCMSRVNRSEDFWLSSVSGVIETDPIDISSTAVQASTMYAAVPHNRDLVVFSNQGQFVIFGRSSLNSDNATLTLTTAFEAELAAKPVASGRNVFFATNYGRFTGIREFFTEGGTDINDTRPITQHVKEYIVGRVKHMAASSNYDMLAVNTESSGRDLYVYQYIWQDVNKVQSAWSTWQFLDPVVHFFFTEEVLYTVHKHRFSNQHYMQRTSLDIIDAEGAGYPIMLDSRYDIPNVNTTHILPAAHLVSAVDQLVFVQGEGCPNPGMTVPIKSVSGNVVTFRYDMKGGNVTGGVRYMSRYRPTMPLLKDAGGTVQSSAKLRVKQFLCSLFDTGDINGQMLSPYGNSEVIKFQARIIGDINNVVGRTPLSNETFAMPFRERTDRADFVLFTDSHLPMTLLDIEWQGQYSKRGRRIAEGGN